MTPIQEGGQTLRTSLDVLRGYPALALVLMINVMFLFLIAGTFYLAWSARTELHQLLRNCLAALGGGVH